MQKDIADIRKDYKLGALDEADVHADPMTQFALWFEQAVAAELPEVNAMALATAHDGQPSLRIVLLKGLENGGFTFFTNYGSRKSKDIKDNPKVALTFFWEGLERQVRIEGSAEQVSAEESDAYYHSRGRESQVGAWASPQSEVIKDRDILELRVKRFAQTFQHDEIVPRPAYWGGWRVMPHRIEFWQGRPSRLHDRILYRKIENGTWIRERLAP